jgi:hypothetical protein
MGNIKYDDDCALTHDSYRIVGNVKYDDDRALTHDSYRLIGNVQYDDDCTNAMCKIVRKSLGTSHMDDHTNTQTRRD